MKTIETIILVLSLCVMNQFANAQCPITCNGNKIAMVKPMPPLGMTKCVSPGSVQHYLIQGWYILCPSNRFSGGDLIIQTSVIRIYPNPISNSTTISFSLSQSQNVSLKIFDMNGRLVSTLADKVFEAGENEIVWNAENVNAGIYFLQFQSGENLQMEKLIVTK